MDLQVISNDSKNRLEKIFIEISLFEKNELTQAKEKGAFYTSPEIAMIMIGKILNGKSKKEILNSYYCEPCNGCGIFSFAFFEYLISNYGIDTAKFVISEKFIAMEQDELANKKFIQIFTQFYKNYPCPKTIIGDSLTISIKNILNILGDGFRGFDFIFGNPPYGTKNQKCKVLIEFDTKSKMPTDVYGLFMAKFIGMLSNKGKLSFITPKSFLNAKTFTGLRKNIVLPYLQEVIFCPKDCFKNKHNGLSPSIETVISIFSKSNVDDLIVIKEGSHLSIKKLSTSWTDKTENFNISRAIINKISGNPISKFLSDMEVVSALISNNIKIKDVFDSAMGIKTADNERFVSKTKKKGFIPFHKGTSKEEQAFISTPCGYLNFELLKKNRPKNSNIPSERFLNVNNFRVGVPEIGHLGETRAFPIGKDSVSNSIWIYVPKNNENGEYLSIKLIKLLNSDLYKKISKTYSNGFRIEKHEIDNFPFII